LFSIYRSGEYYQLINIQHHLLDDSPHSIQVHLSVEGTGGSSSGSGDAAPNSDSGSNGLGNSTNPIDLLQEPGFVAGVVVSIVCLCVVAVALLLCRKCCNCCCKPSRRNQFEKANKKKGTPSTKFSKIILNDDDDDDDLDGLELAQSSFSSKNNNNNNTNEFGIVRSQRSGSRIPLQPSSSSSSSSASLGLKLVSGVVLDPDEFEPTWQAMDLTKLWGSTLKVLPTEQEWEDLLAADSISCMASGQVEDTQKFYFYATDSSANLYLVEASITKSSKRLACVFKTSSTPKNKSSGGGDANTKLLNEFIDFFRNRIVGYLTRL
jgi:hypothetical protein